MESRMTPAALHSLILSSGLPEEKWPCRYDEPVWVGGCGVIASVEAERLFVAVLVEELACVGENDGFERLYRDHYRGDFDYRVKIMDKPLVAGRTLLEALCIAHRDRKAP